MTEWYCVWLKESNTSFNCLASEYNLSQLNLALADTWPTVQLECLFGILTVRSNQIQGFFHTTPETREAHRAHQKEMEDEEEEAKGWHD